MCNFIALYAVGFLVRGPLQEPTGVFPQSASIDASLRLSPIIGGTRLHGGFLIAVVVALFAWWYISRTAGGLRLRVLGANAHAARSAGQIHVDQLSFRVFLVSGALAGLAGGIEVLGVTYALYENLSPGYGYTAIAVALLARLHPLGIIATAVLLGAIATGGAAMQRDAGVPATMVSVMEAVIVLAVLAFDATMRRRVTP
jgi:simple sugar transport system permease protein